MLCYEVSINGDLKYTAGIDDPDLFEARIDKLPGDDRFVLSVTATLPPQESPYGHLSWGAAEVGVGDVVSIRLVDVRAADPPASPAEPDIDETRLQCSFCGRGNDETARLIAGPDALICDGCVRLCAGIIEE